MAACHAARVAVKGVMPTGKRELRPQTDFDKLVDDVMTRQGR